MSSTKFNKPVDDEIKTINEQIALANGSMSPASSAITINESYVKKSLNVVNVYVYATKSSAITQNQWTDFAVISAFKKCRPLSMIVTLGLDNNHDIPCEVRINESGVISVYGASANSGMTALKLICCYIVDD